MGKQNPTFSNYAGPGTAAALLNSKRLTLHVTPPDAQSTNVDIPKTGLADALNTWPGDCLHEADTHEYQRS